MKVVNTRKVRAITQIYVLLSVLVDFSRDISGIFWPHSTVPVLHIKSGMIYYRHDPKTRPSLKSRVADPHRF
jgi:hypothetical protein